MDPIPSATTETPASARPSWRERWWLLLANVLVLNAASLHVGPGGLRTPSEAVNLWICALVLLPAVLVWFEGRSCALRLRERSFATISFALVGGALATVLSPFVFSMIGLAAMFVFMAVLFVLPSPSFGMWCLVGVIVVLLVDAVRPSLRETRCGRWFRIVRGIALLPPHVMLGFVLLFVVVDSRAWIGGRDSMFEPVARIDDGPRSYLAVRSDPMAFTKPVLRILVATPLVPGVLGWWRELGSLYDVSEPNLGLDGDELYVDYRSRHFSGEWPLKQRRFRVR